MYDTKKFENIDDPKIKELVEQIREFIFPKAMEFQEKLKLENLGMLKKLKLTMSFLEETSKEYKDKFGTDMSEDSKLINDYLGISQSDVMGMMDMLKKFKK